MVLATERLAADVTRIGSFVCVSALVDEEVVGFGEMALAIFADELFLWSTAGHWPSHPYGSSASSVGSAFAGEALARNVLLMVLMEVMVLLLLVKGCTAEPLVHEECWICVRSWISMRIRSGWNDWVAAGLVLGIGGVV